MRAAALLLLACFSAIAAEELTWKDANKQSAEALRGNDPRRGADLAKMAFDLYPVQAQKYNPHTHGQLLLNLADARLKADDRGAALREIESGIEAVTARAGEKDPNLPGLWDEAARIAVDAGKYPLAERYYDKAIDSAGKAWGENDLRTLALHGRQVRDIRRVRGADWAERRFLKIRDAALAVPGGETLVSEAEQNLAKNYLESKQYGKAIAVYEPAIARLEAREPSVFQNKELQVLYAQLAHAYDKAGDKEGVARTQARLEATWSDGGLVPILRVTPQYPADAARRRLEGRVVMHVEVDPEGKVTDVRVIEAAPEGVFDAAAMKAVRQWKFKPRIENGVGVPQTGTQIMNFTMERPR